MKITTIDDPRRLNLIQKFNVDLQNRLDEAEREAPGVVRVTPDEIFDAINALQFWERQCTDHELWIVHQYLNYMESLVAEMLEET